jgi:hypothetical protein
MKEKREREREREDEPKFIDLLVIDEQYAISPI